MEKYGLCTCRQVRLFLKVVFILGKVVLWNPLSTDYSAVKKTELTHYTVPDEGHYTPSLFYKETAPEGGWQVQHPPIILTVIPFLNTNRGQRQFKGKGSVCLHSRAASMLLKWSDSQCLWVLEAHNLCVLLGRATGHLMWGGGGKG